MIKHPSQFEVADEIISPEQIRATLPSDSEMKEIARTFQALSDPTRSKIILLLTRYELSVNEIAGAIGTSASGVSHHLKGLRDIRLVKHRRDGNQIYYTVDDAHVASLFHEAVSHLDHVRRNLPDHRAEPFQRPTKSIELEENEKEFAGTL